MQAPKFNYRFFFFPSPSADFPSFSKWEKSARRSEDRQGKEGRNERRPWPAVRGVQAGTQAPAPYLEGPFQCKISAQWNRASSLPSSPCHRGPYPTPCCTSRQSSPGRLLNKRLAFSAFNGRGGGKGKEKKKKPKTEKNPPRSKMTLPEKKKILRKWQN